ncbi:MAG: PASTA domain-containing protein [Clostridia bacterium]|nr:PASTA domain-containing protein [Clostridia bacterium]
MGNKDSDKTKQYKIKAEKQPKNKKEGKKKGKKKHSKLKKAILICFVLVVLLGLAGVGVVAGIFLSDKWTLTREELVANENSVVLDSKGKQIAVLSASEGSANRKLINFDQMGKYTADAYVAVEDKRFYEHDGVDILRTGKATVSYLLHKADGSSVGGGSTITQQLVKNLMSDDAGSGKEGIERKIREMSRAYQLEKILKKEEILEKYLNVIFVGGNELHGVEYGAQYYFAKSAKDLDLAESCFLAGINHSPNAYNPYNKENDHAEKIKTRTKFVLDLMKEQNKISDNPEEAEKIYNEALEKVEKGLKFKQGKLAFGNTNSYFIEEAVKETAQDLAKQKKISLSEADRMIRSGGYKLYTTQDSTIQKTVVKEMAKKSYIETRTTTVKENGKNVTKKVGTQAGMTIIDFKTGKVVAMGGAFGSDKGTDYNYATSTEKQTGSSIKPLANVSAGLEEKVITAATVYEDTTTEFANVNSGISYRPKNAGGYQGLCTVRKAIEVSSNIVNIKVFSNIGAKTVIEYLHAFGLDTYTEKDDSVLSLAIGGSKHSSSTLQMAAAYAALANDGVYIEPTFYEKLVDADGNTVLEPEQETHRVISAANAYIVKQILMDVVTGAQGTANECYMTNIDVAAKTGTTENDSDTWLCGFTPYYAAATWNGYPDGNYTMYNVGNARKLWANVMKTVHKDKKAARFKKPSNVVTASICRSSGNLATKKCGSTYTEYFVEGTVPKACDGHEAEKICKETGKLANEYCPEVEEKVFAKQPEKEQNAGWKVIGKKDKYSVPTEKCTKHNEETSKITVENVVGKTEAEARALLAGLNITVIEGHDATQADGIVLTQSLTEGTRVEKGVAITITVNKLTTTDPGGDNSGGGTPPGGENPPDGGTPPAGGNTTTGGGTTTNPGGTTTKP